VSGAAPARLPPAALRRRLAAMVYEGVLLFGVVMAAGWIYAVLMQQRHALQGKLGLQVFLFVVLAAYFIWAWTHGGQTLAMKTWRIRLVGVDGRPPSFPRACARFLLAWLWFVPALLISHLAGLQGAWPISVVLLGGVLTYATASRLHPDRQFPHDALCGTRLVDTGGSTAPR